MARKTFKNNQAQKNSRQTRVNAQPIDILKRLSAGLVLMALAIYIGWVLHKGANLHPTVLNSQLGLVGSFFYRVTHSLVGQMGFLVPTFIFISGLSLAVPKIHFNRYQVIGLIGFCVCLLAWRHAGIDLSESFSYGRAGIGGGLIGAVVSYAFVKLLSPIGAKIFLFVIMICMLLLASRGFVANWFINHKQDIRYGISNFGDVFKNFIFVNEEEEDDDEYKNKYSQNKQSDNKKSLRDRLPIFSGDRQSIDEKSLAKAESGSAKKSTGVKKNISVNAEETMFIENLKEFHEKLVEEEKQQKVRAYIEGGFADAAASMVTSPDKIYHFPSLDLLENISPKGLKLDQDEIDNNAQIIEQTLQDFGVKGRISEVSIGPTITEYEFQPAPGIKVSKILNLADDLALSLATSGIRIQAPIPGKPAVGIEVPNKKARVVRIKEIIASNIFTEADSKLTVALGKDISGKAMITDLAKMPHLLIAGSTGSGKSVCLNALIISILYKAKPYEVKFLMIDPKMVELGNYNGIPHLIAPVVTDSKKAAASLRWAVKEMERRYERFAEVGAKDMKRYNEKCLEKQALGDFSTDTELMPQIVVIIDELADLMMVAPADVEDAICRLAQMARAAGIHLVIATQRPSVDVITGIIKANIPSRVAFAVSSQIDSRTILDMGGAEKLLGRGDMLFYPTGIAKPKRIQGVYVTDDEIDAVVADIKKQGKPVFDEDVTNCEINEGPKSDLESEEKQDELLGEACRLFIENGQASISMLQRHFKVGYTRAARIIDELERLGYVGPYEGSKPRQIRISLEEHDRVFGKQEQP